VGNYLVPQEIEFKSASHFLLCSAIEVNKGEINTPLTDELLVIENDLCLTKFQLGKHGIGTNKRNIFNNLEELMNNKTYH
jgi:hypothetical protein